MTAALGTSEDWMRIARAEAGVKERPGPKLDNPRILEYLASVIHSHMTLHDEIAWCAAFVNWVLTKAGLKGTGKANARSYMSWGRRLAQPVYGCIAVYSRGTDKTLAHVAFWTGRIDRYDVIFGGNQQNSVCSQRRPRILALGYYWPESIPLPPGAVLA